MANTRSGSVVNEHYLKKVVALSEEMGVSATEDIYDANGTKLLAKGATVSRQLQERLIIHRLRKPIESCISVEGGIDGRQLAHCARQACEDSPNLAAVLAASGTTVTMVERELSSLRFAPATTMMLTMADRGDSGGLRHLVEVAALGLAFATHAGLTPDLRRVVAMAGVLHDIGELYIDPNLINAKHVLTPEEWSHVIVHPHIGKLLIQDLETCPPAVAVAVAEHHERLNGTGYPRAMVSGQSSVAGQLVAAAEQVAGLLHKRNALERAELALKIVSGEHPRSVLALVSQASRTLGRQPIDNGSVRIDDEEIARLSARMSDALKLVAQLDSGSVAPRYLDVLHRTRARLAVVQRAFISTGLDMYVGVCEAGQPDSFEIFESELALREITWRVRDIGRDLAMQLGDARTSIGKADELLQRLCE